MLLRMRKKRYFAVAPFKGENTLTVCTKTVEVVHGYDGKRQLFVSDPLPNMCGMAYDRAGDRLLAYNANGTAHLYDMSNQTLLFSKLKLNKNDGNGDGTVAFFGDQCYYINKKDGLSCLDMNTGTICQLPAFENRQIRLLFGSEEKLYLFYVAGEVESSFVRVEEYRWAQNELTLQREKELRDISAVHKLKRDFDGVTGVLSVEKQGSNAFYLAAFDPETLELHLLDENRPKTVTIFEGFHTYLQKDLIAYAMVHCGAITRRSTGEYLERYNKYTEPDGIEGCCDALFVEPSVVLFASWEGLYYAESMPLQMEHMRERGQNGNEYERELSGGVEELLRLVREQLKHQ